MTASPTTSQETLPAEPLRFANAVEVAAAGPPHSDGEVFVTFYADVPDPASGDCHRDLVARFVMTRSAATAMQAALNERLSPVASPDIENARRFGINLDHDPVLRAIWENDDDAIYDEG